MKVKNMTKKISFWFAVVAGILMIPFLTKAPWTSGDFVFAGVTLFSLAMIYESITRNMKNPKHKLFVGFGILIVIILIMGWAATGTD